MMKLLKTPNTFTFDGTIFESHAKKIASDTALLTKLKKTADGYLNAKSPSVIDRKIRGESGDPHDYASFGPYWWPNPNTENGLPYIRRDGEINPETKETVGWGTVFTSVNVLTLAAYYFDRREYAEKAVKNIEVWYLDPETCCNPHLKYGQAIPGICQGRGIGLIDCSQSYQLFDAVAILEAMGCIPDKTLNGLKDWYSKFVDWMLTSETGIDEDRQHNNHGAWYDVQVGSAALFLGRPILAERTLSLAYERRILKHIQPDGRQPFELARTKALSYSIYNLHALTIIANLAVSAKCKRNMWHSERDDGSIALKVAIDYITQFAETLDGFPYQQLDGKTDTDGCAKLLSMAARHYPDSDYAERAAKYQKETQLWRLLPL